MTNLLQRLDLSEYTTLAVLVSDYEWGCVSLRLAGSSGQQQWCSSQQEEVVQAFDQLESLGSADGCAFEDIAAAGHVALAGGSPLRAYAAVRCLATLPDGRNASCVIAVGDSRARAMPAKSMQGLAVLAKQCAAQLSPPFGRIFDALPGSYLVVTPERYEIVAASDARLAATMVTREEMVGRLLFDAFPDDPNDSETSAVGALRRSLERVKETRKTDVMAVQRYPIRRAASEGGGFVLKYWSPINSPVLNPDGSLAFIIHRVEDVTDFVLAREQGSNTPGLDLDGQRADVVLRSRELKRLADSLIESERRFRYVTQATNDVVWDWDLASDTLWCSRGGAEPFGEHLAGLETLGQWIDAIHPDDRARVVASLRASVAASKENWIAEYRMLVGATVLDVLHRSFLVLDDKQQAQRMVGSITDLSERKRQEAKVREQAELLDYATDAILVRDLDNRVTYWNRAAEARYGWTGEEMIGRPVSESLYAGSSGGQFAQAMEALMRFGDFSGRMVHTARDGQRFVEHAHWILVRHADGAPRAILTVITDLSERVALEQRLAQKERLESLGRLTGGIAHDFNNWLTVIVGSAEELVEALEDDPYLLELASMTQMAASRAAELTRRLLAFARRQPLAPEVIAVGPVVNAMRLLVRHSLRENIALQFNLAQEQWYVFVDPAQLEASILNLCINARDAMPEGGRLTIDVSNVAVEFDNGNGGEPLAAGEYVVIGVSDTGSGIPPEVLDRLFEPFVTTKGGARGYGLGLSMVYGFVRQSNGNVTIESQTGRGTTVRLYLPRSYREADAGDQDAALPDVDAGAFSILLVEDDAIVRQHVCGQLLDLGYSVEAAESAEAALAVLESGRPFDVLFTDIVMPGMNGIELAREALRQRPGLRVLLSSGYSLEAMSPEMAEHPDMAMLHKPYGKATLVRALAALTGSAA